MVSAAHANKRRSVDAKHLSKVWQIDIETTQKTIDIKSQNCGRADNPI